MARPCQNIHTGNGWVKSQRGGPADIFVSHSVKWPHEYVLSGQNKDRFSYNRLSPIQWMHVFLQRPARGPVSKVVC